jgi:hypothetical protein
VREGGEGEEEGEGPWVPVAPVEGGWVEGGWVASEARLARPNAWALGKAFGRQSLGPQLAAKEVTPRLLSLQHP